VDHEGLHRDGLVRSLELALIEPGLCSVFVRAELDIFSSTCCVGSGKRQYQYPRVERAKLGPLLEL
jgi:hypothetical protein